MLVTTHAGKMDNFHLAHLPILLKKQKINKRPGLGNLLKESRLTLRWRYICTDDLQLNRLEFNQELNFVFQFCKPTESKLTEL